MRIFKNKPSISVSVTDDSTAVVIADGALKNVLQGRAPSTGIVIEQQVDCSISKSLKKDFIGSLTLPLRKVWSNLSHYSEQNDKKSPIY